MKTILPRNYVSGHAGGTQVYLEQVHTHHPNETK